MGDICLRTDRAEMEKGSPRAPHCRQHLSGGDAVAVGSASCSAEGAGSWQTLREARLIPALVVTTRKRLARERASM